MTQTGPIRDLDRLIAGMEPHLHAAPAGFVAARDLKDALGRWPEQAIIGTFREAEGLTVILDLSDPACRDCRPVFVAAWLTLTVHSDLEAVGLTAAFAAALGAEGISCNVVAALHHDHIFVPLDDGPRALAVLEALQAGAARRASRP